MILEYMKFDEPSGNAVPDAPSQCEQGFIHMERGPNGEVMAVWNRELTPEELASLGFHPPLTYPFRP